MRIPSTSLTQSQAMQFELERTVSAIPEVAFIFSKTGTAELAADPMPPSVSDTFVIFKPVDAWRSEAELDQVIEQTEAALAKQGEHAGGHDEHGEEEAAVSVEGHKGKLIKLIELSVQDLPGQNYEFTQPIQMRFNELVAGVRGDVAVKLYGDDFDTLTATANDIARAMQSVAGAADVKVEQTSGLPVLTVDIDRDAISRYGLNISDVQDVVAIAMGGREAGLVFEGDRRFDLVVRMPDEIRNRLDHLENLPIPLRAADGDKDLPMGFVPLSSVAKIEVAEGTNQISRENGKRRVVVQANVRGRDLGSFVAEAQAKVTQVKLPTGSWLEWGGQYENLVAAKERLAIVVPVCFLLIFLLLFSSFKSVRYALLVFSAVPLGLTGGSLALWLRGHAVFDLGIGRLYCALRRRRAQWISDDQFHQPTATGRRGAR